MLNRWQRKTGSWLGLLAILLTTLAPTVSQTLAAHHAYGAHLMPAGEPCEMASMAAPHASDTMAGMDDMSDMAMQHAGTPEAAPAASHAANDPDDSDSPASKHSQLSAGDACGYCSLLAHLPALPGVAMLFVAAVRARQHTVATRFESVRRVEPLTFAQPRAPPSAS